MKPFRWLFQNRSLWYKFTLISVAPIILATLFIVLFIVNSIEKSMIHETRTRAVELTRLSALSISNASVIYNKTLLDSFVDNLGREKDIVFAMIVDGSDGRILAHSDHRNDGGLAAGTRPEQSREAHGASGPPAGAATADSIQASTAPIVIEGKTYGQVRVAFSLDDVYRKVNHLKRKIMTVAGIAVLIGVLFAAFLARIISRPIRALAQHALQIGAGNYEKQIFYESRDALGQLADALNRMVSDIKERQERIKAEIHERKRAVEYQRRYDFIVNAARDWHTLINRDYVYEAVNDAYCRSLDRPRREILGKTVAEIWGESVFTGVIRKYLDRCFNGEEINYQAWFEPTPEVSRYFNVTYYPYRDHSRNVTHAVVISNDITHLKRTEAALQQRVREMTTLNTLTQRISSSLSIDAVIEAAIDAIIEAARPDAAMLFLRNGDRLQLRGYRSTFTGSHREDAVEHRVGECLCGLSVSGGAAVYSGDIRSDPRCARDECTRAGLVSFMALPLRARGEIIGVMGFGSQSVRNFEESLEFLEALSGEMAIAVEKAALYEQVQHHAAVLEQRVAERTAELAEAMEKAQAADHLKSAFLAAMSHELRTPLNSIIGFTGIMLQGLVGDLNPEQSKQLGMVRDSAHHLLRLISDVLDISKIEAGQLEIETEPFPIRDAVDKAIGTLTPIAGKKGLSITVRVARDVDTITGDRRRVEQILINLLNNAVKFTESGSIRVDIRRKDQMVETRIIDSGIGIKPEDMDKLFKAFQQIDTGLTRRYEGSGLGLSICKKLVEMMGGHIWVDSDWGKGSTFGFMLPLHPETGDDHGKPEFPESGPNG